MKLSLIISAFLLLIIGGNLMAEAKNTNTEKWDKTFKKSEKINVEKVSFPFSKVFGVYKSPTSSIP